MIYVRGGNPYSIKWILLTFTKGVSDPEPHNNRGQYPLSQTESKSTRATSTESSFADLL
ncbi:hypothetical protein C1H46_014031 [Malus baccata]|uniref:Uncharacterized protein n=1 Tax=Malus baccata TaxID=106549 RepID=A0A540MNC5_MALBA|nr:hypothetical protein C1H46_014031 [Malus baccata]